VQSQPTAFLYLSNRHWFLAGIKKYLLVVNLNSTIFFRLNSVQKNNLAENLALLLCSMAFFALKLKFFSDFSEYSFKICSFQ